MDVLDDHIKHAHETLEAAQTSVNAAQKRYDTLGDAASAEFLREAQVAHDDAQAAYAAAVNAKGSSEAGNTSNP